MSVFACAGCAGPPVFGSVDALQVGVITCQSRVWARDRGSPNPVHDWRCVRSRSFGANTVPRDAQG